MGSVSVVEDRVVNEQVELEWIDKVHIDVYASFRESGLLRDLHPNSVVVFLALALRMNSDRQCWPGVKTICKDTGLCRDAVFIALNELEEFGLIERKRRKNGKFKSNFYTVAPKEVSGVGFGSDFAPCRDIPTWNADTVSGIPDTNISCYDLEHHVMGEPNKKSSEQTDLNHVNDDVNELVKEEKGSVDDSNAEDKPTDNHMSCNQPCNEVKASSDGKGISQHSMSDAGEPKGDVIDAKTCEVVDYLKQVGFVDAEKIVAEYGSNYVSRKIAYAVSCHTKGIVKNFGGFLRDAIVHDRDFPAVEQLKNTRAYEILVNLDFWDPVKIIREHGEEAVEKCYEFVMSRDEIANKGAYMRSLLESRWYERPEDNKPRVKELKTGKVWFVYCGLGSTPTRFNDNCYLLVDEEGHRVLIDVSDVGSVFEPVGAWDF